MADKSVTSSEQSQSFLRMFRAFVLLGVLGWLGFTVFQNATTPEAAHPFKLGLDLAGGSHLVYEADTSKIDQADVPELMSVLRDVIERRVNIFGVSEPIVQVEQSSFVTETPTQRLVVELPGVTDVSEAIQQIGETPLLEFKLYSAELASEIESLQGLESLMENATSTATGTDFALSTTTATGEVITSDQLPFVDTGLTGRYLKTAQLGFAGGTGGQMVNEPLVEISFNEQGADLFEQITREHTNEQLGIFLDGELLSAPVINEPIGGGRATISGNFTAEEARDLARNLSFGALPVPIELQSTQTIDASLGAGVLQHSVMAAVYGFALVLLFMLVWYRLPGLVAGFALLSYIIIMLALFQYIPVTLTAAGLAGFVLSLGMAVDANVLVFERMKEEFRAGSGSREAARTGFKRAWSAIRDGNVTSLLSAMILFWFGTSMVKGFALVFGLGTILSMFSALVVTRTLLLTLPDVRREGKGLLPRLLGSGLKK
jgi:preprotein translocase subunit SecD